MDNNRLIRKMQTAAGGPIKRPRIKLNGQWRELNYEGNGNFSTLTEKGKVSFTTGQKSPKSIIGNKEIVVTPEKTTVLDKQDNTKNYYSAYNPDDIIKGFNALTLGGLNNLSPTLWARRYYDLYGLIDSKNPTMNFSKYVDNWLNGNNGIVLSEKYALEHPYKTMLFNGIGDAVALGGIANANKINRGLNFITKHGTDAAKITLDVAKNSSKPLNLKNYKFLGDKRFYGDLENSFRHTILDERKAGNYPLTFAERRNYITNLKGDIQKGVDYAINEAKENVKVPLRRGKEVEYTFGLKFEPYSLEDILPLKIHFGTLKSTKVSGATPWEGDYGAFLNKYKGLFFPLRDRPNTLRTHSMLQDVGERIGTGAHETRHTVLSYFDTPLTIKRYDMPGSYQRYTNSNLPLEFKKKVNGFINDAGTAGEWRGSLSEMDAELTGWRALYNLPRYSEMNPLQKAQIYDLFQKRFGGENTDYLDAAFLLRDNNKILNPMAVKRNVKAIDDSKVGQIILGLEELGYRKQGGKMNVIDFLKKGSGIHIKKENRGKFTDYCGGKVTSECIARGKASSNPAIRKRATFAANARKWKHLEGGVLKEGLYIPDNGYLLFVDFEKLPFTDKLKRRVNIAKAQFNNGSIAKAGYALFGGYDPENPRQSTGIAPTPDKVVNMSLYKNAKHILSGPQTNEGFVNFVDRLAQGKITPEFIGKRRTVSPAIYNYVDLKSEVVPKGFTKGNDITSSTYQGTYENLRNVSGKLKNKKWLENSNPITDEGSLQAAKDYLEMLKELGLGPKNATTVVRGRPKGSKNKPKPVEQPKPIIRETQTKTADLTLHERYTDRRDFTKKQRQLDKFARSMETEKANNTNSGNYGMKRRQKLYDWELMDNYYPFLKEKLKLLKRQAKLETSGKFQGLAKKQWMKDQDALIERFRNTYRFKLGGIFKAEGGAKTTFWNKIGNVAKSEAGLQFISNGINLLANKLFGQGASSDSEIAKAGLDLLYFNDEQQAKSIALLLALNALAQMQDPNNPNAFAGDIMGNQLYLYYLNLNLASLKQNLLNKKASIDMQAKQLQALQNAELFGLFVNSGIGLINLFSLKNKG